VTGVTCSFYIDEAGTSHGNLCDMTKSSITVSDDKNETHTVFLNNPTLQIKNMTVEEAKQKYKSGSNVSLIYNNAGTTGTIIGHSITVGSKFISKDDIIHVKVPGTDGSLSISFTDPSLKLVEESSSGNQKYTLEDKNKYRVKYAKYKAKYLLQKK
jgi:hypothetical protein